MYFLHGSGLLLIVGNILDLGSSWQNTHICSEANESLMKIEYQLKFWLLFGYCALSKAVSTLCQRPCVKFKKHYSNAALPLIVD